MVLAMVRHQIPTGGVVYKSNRAELHNLSFEGFINLAG